MHGQHSRDGLLGAVTPDQLASGLPTRYEARCGVSNAHDAGSIACFAPCIGPRRARSSPAFSTLPATVEAVSAASRPKNMKNYCVGQQARAQAAIKNIAPVVAVSAACLICDADLRQTSTSRRTMAGWPVLPAGRPGLTGSTIGQRPSCRDRSPPRLCLLRFSLFATDAAHAEIPNCRQRGGAGRR